MTARRQKRYHVEAEVTPLQVPTNWMTQLGSQLPLTFVVGGVVGLAVWYGTTNAERGHSNSEVSKLSSRVDELNKANVATTKEQDERRAAMAKEFLASNKEIATKVGDLSTALAVQQATQKATSDALVKIGEQLQQLNAANKRVR